MTGDVVIVTHHTADEPLARDVALELSPFAAFPMHLSEAKPARLGAGAIGVIVWTPKLARAFPEHVLEQLAQDAIIFWTGGAVPASAGLLIEAGASAGEALRCAVAEEQAARQRARQQGGGERLVPAATAAGAYAARSAGGRLAMQSASGLAAALAVVGIATPMLGGGRAADDHEATGVSLSLVGEARAAAGGRVTPISMRTSVLAARPQAESALDALVQNEAPVSPVVLRREPARNPIQPVSGDPLQVEILSNGEVVSGLDIAPIEYESVGELVSAEDLLMTADFMVDEDADFSPADGPDLNSFHRMMGPPE